MTVNDQFVPLDDRISWSDIKMNPNVWSSVIPSHLIVYLGIPLLSFCNIAGTLRPPDCPLIEIYSLVCLTINLLLIANDFMILLNPLSDSASTSIY